MASSLLSRLLPGAESAANLPDQHDLEAGGFDDEQELDNMLVEAPRRKRRHSKHAPPSSNDSDQEIDVPPSLIMEQNDAPLLVNQDPRPPPAAPIRNKQTPTPRRTRIDRRDQALWRWANVENVDGFLLQVYGYYVHHGVWSILLARLIHLLTTAFLFSAYIFLSTCIDYSKIPTSKSTPEILIPKCMANLSFFKTILVWTFVFWWLWKIFGYITDIRRLWHLHDFYHYLLGIPDSDIQTIAWERVVEGLMALRDANPETADKIPRYMQKVAKTTQSKQRMDAHDIANRLMRRDNYFIALVNKEILDLQLEIPFLGPRNFYSKSLEWCLSACFDNFIFDSHGHVKQTCLDPKERHFMIENLSTRFRRVAVISVLMAPFNISLQCILFFSKYYAEFRNSPARLGARAFTPLAEWKMRDFNELEHDFTSRLNMAYPSADRYLAQFPRAKTIQILQFVSLVSGTFAAVLGIATLLDPELFLGFDVTPNRTAFFYLSISMGIFAAARSAVPDEGEVHQPVLNLFEAIEYTHYAPQRWRNNFHTEAVRAEFSALYQMKVLIFLDEILSLFAAPFILWKNSGKQSAAIVDFFRQNTVHVDGLGGLCNHAVFEFRKRTRPEDDDELRALEYFGTSLENKDQKMLQSQRYFLQRLDQYEGRRHHRTVSFGTHHHHPPTFPPASPLREAARPRARMRPDSPTQSVLLDLPRTTARRTQRRPRPPRDDLDLARADADLTTSKLIEADHSLAESWKFDDVADEEAALPEKRNADQDAGVMGLLMEYTRAHEKKGGRI